MLLGVNVQTHFFSFFRSHVCRIRFHDSVVIFLFRMFAASFFQIPPRGGPLAIGYTIPAIRAYYGLAPVR